MTDKFRVLVWDDENLDWFLDIINRLEQHNDKWSLSFVDCDKNKESHEMRGIPRLRDVWKILRRLMDSRKDEANIEIEFDIYNSRRVETATFKDFQILLTDIRMEYHNEYQDEDKLETVHYWSKYLDTLRDVNKKISDDFSRGEMQYGLTVLAEMAHEENPNLSIIVASGFEPKMKQKIEFNKKIGAIIFGKPNPTDNTETKYSSIDSIVQMITIAVSQWKGMNDDLVKERREKSEIKATLSKVKGKLTKYKKYEELIQKGKGKTFIGDSDPMQELYLEIARRAVKNKEVNDRAGNDDMIQNVFISGETGTGKELVAKRLFELSSRSKKGLFVPVNVAIIPENIVESELFGHVKGAFSGAINDKKGFFECASGGIFFMDEIGEMSISVQSKILRTLQEKTIQRVGAPGVDIEVDVLVITATHRDINDLIERREFRDDLSYRLNIGAPICLPPLRIRGKADIEDLIKHFAKILFQKYNHTELHLSDELLAVLFNYGWPGNVRELGECIKHLYTNATHLEGDDSLSVEHLPLKIRKSITCGNTATSNDIEHNAENGALPTWTCPICGVEISKAAAKEAHEWLNDIVNKKKGKISPSWIGYKKPHKDEKDACLAYNLKQGTEFSLSFFYLIYQYIIPDKNIDPVFYCNIFIGHEKDGKLWGHIKRKLKYYCGAQNENNLKSFHEESDKYLQLAIYGRQFRKKLALEPIETSNFDPIERPELDKQEDEPRTFT